MKQVKTKPKNINKFLPYVLVFCAALGLLASFVLTYDKIQVLKNPLYDPPCNINPVLSCGSVMKTEQASLLGVPNTIFGIMGFTALITFGVLILASTGIKKWVWQVAQVAATTGVLFMHYLFFQGVFRINAICPWCFVTWMVTIPIFVYVTAFNLQENNLPVPKRLHKIATWIQRNYGNILISWYVIIFLILLNHFWYYWQTLL